MFILYNLIFILFITTIQCANITVQFATFPVNTDIGSCTCDLTQNVCDISCCCDPSCLSGDLEVFQCSSKENQFTNTTSVISSVQPTCFKNISIFKSTSPYIIQKMGELVCVDYERYKGSQYYQQPSNQLLNPQNFIQSINEKYTVSSSVTFPTNRTSYQVGDTIWTNNTSVYYSLPVKLFNSQFCSGSEMITYMNNFTSTCSQLVDNNACDGVLNPMTYINSLCLVKSLSNPSDFACANTNIPSSSFSGTTCTNALKSLTVTIYYSNPGGIANVSIDNSTDTANDGTSFEQTFNVQFIKTVSSSLSSNATRSPGYLQGATVTAGTINGTAIDTVDSSLFSILKPSSDGTCNQNSRTPIRFGENIRSTCKYTPGVQPNCSTLYDLLMPINPMNVRVAAYSNPNPSNSSIDWLPVLPYTLPIGSTNTFTYGISNNTPCSVKLDIQISYTNIGSVLNPQHVLSAVIFYYQTLTTTTSPFLVMGSVTFQDISNTPIVEQGRIPTPNTRLPADFFYPFTVSHGTKSVTFSLISYLFITVFLILM